MPLPSPWNVHFPPAGVLREGRVLPASTLLSQDAQAPPNASVSAYLSVLSGVQHILTSLDSPVRAQLLAAVGALSQGLPSKSSVKAACMRLQHALFLGYTR